ncbi:hypothetical protein ACFFKE_22580 [Streptomyces mutabilis]|uniref:hypothetical protein n=1 Tax=Streptomyces mutabilis TaxID=67332 RepID=UPI00177C62B7|nr:hypothetical protein [Streptomyces mutabilis]GGQ08657.1 hypothetical protein GCM10010279_15260 [Streptomyces mutabilis]
MPYLIGRLVTWAAPLLEPRGTHRRTGPRPATLTAPLSSSTIGIVPLPTHRSPYGLPPTLDGTGTVAVRPCVVLPAPYELGAAA